MKKRKITGQIIHEAFVEVRNLPEWQHLPKSAPWEGLTQGTQDLYNAHAKALNALLQQEEKPRASAS